MSFVDLATLALHRRNEMDVRINAFLKKCDHSISEIHKLQVKARGFVNRLNCDPTELKDRFLQCMKQLDEYNYLITDFNMSMEKLEELESVEQTPVHDNSTILKPIEVERPNLIDILSEPTPSTSAACWNLCNTEKPRRRKTPKSEQILIQFSSGSCSAESVPEPSQAVTLEREVQCDVTSEINELSLNDETDVSASSSTNIVEEVPASSIPAQTMLQTDQLYRICIMSVDGTNFWVVNNPMDACSLIQEMTAYYKERRNKFNMDDTSSLTYCAYYDDETNTYCRGLLIRLTEEEADVAEVFLIDTGEIRAVRAGCTEPLAARFADKPPFARCCHLAGVDLLKCHNKDLMEKQEQFMRKYIGEICTIEVDDNTSESLGVYVTLDDNVMLNDLLVQEGLALSAVEKSAVQNTMVVGLPELVDDEIDITAGPEYEDPVEAVTGYHNRDEADICQFYKGGPEKTCFKGARCKKRHVRKHPDGWTLDRVEVICKLPSLPMPAVDTWHRVLVTYVCHFNRLYVQFQTSEPSDPPPNFGIILPPNNLESLQRDMNSPATRLAYKPLKMTPAPGEMVAALYPPDEKWYRAQVISATRSDQNVEVMYVDYGNVVWVAEDGVRMLEARWARLPAQAQRCVLAGVRCGGGAGGGAGGAAGGASTSAQWARARDQLAAMLHDQTLDAHIVGRTYDELVVELIDKKGYSIAEQLAAREVVTLFDYQVHDDTSVPQKLDVV